MQFVQEKIILIRKRLADKGLYDPRLLVLGFIGLIALSVFWNGAKIIQQNYELQQKVAQIQEENEIFELENRNKELQNEYLKTDEFAEITARRVFGRAAPGERVYIMPRSVALSSLSNQDPESLDQSQPVSIKPKWQQNLEAWLNIYLGS